jgi:parvulin-like peptidyl-prolyl isomerase
MRFVILVLLSAAFSSACSKKAGSSEPRNETAVAVIGGKPVSVTDVERQLALQPDFVRARYASPEARRDFLESLIRNELLVQEARRRGLDQAPEVQSLYEKILVQHLLTQVSSAAAPSEADAKTYYDTHPAEFSRPERVRVSIIEFGPKAGAAPERAKVEQQVGRLRTLKEVERASAFNVLVATFSTHEASRSQDGDLGPRTREELTQLFSEEVATAAFSLKAPGDIAGPVATARGQVALRLLGRTPEEVRPFDAEKGALLSRLTAERRLSVMDDLLASLKKTTPVTVNEKLLENVRLEQLPVAPGGAK